MTTTAPDWSAFYTQLHGFVAARVRGAPDVDDLVQLILERAMSKAQDTDIDSVTGWLFGIARNAIADHFRREARTLVAAADELESTPAAGASDEERVQVIACRAPAQDHGRRRCAAPALGRHGGTFDAGHRGGTRYLADRREEPRTASAHLISLLGALRFTSSSAVWIAAAVGVLQVLGRVVELLAGGRISALRLGLLVFGAQALSLALLLASGWSSWLVLPFVSLYGSANGLLTVVRAVAPLELFGTQQFGAVLGSFAAPSLIARAIAPAAFAVLLARTGALPALGAITGIALLALTAFVAAARRPVAASTMRSALGSSPPV